MAGWRKDGRFNSGPQRHQARFVKEAEEVFEGDDAHARDCVFYMLTVLGICLVHSEYTSCAY